MRHQDKAEDRAARLAEIKRQIKAGTYETPAKLDAALDAFLRDSERGLLRPGQDRPNFRST